MNQELINRIRKNRELKVEVGLPSGKRITLLCRRPTDAEADRIAAVRSNDVEIAREFVLGWNDVTDDDVSGSGNDEPIEFDPAVWFEWVVDLGPVFDTKVERKKSKLYEAAAAAATAAGGRFVTSETSTDAVYPGVWSPIAKRVLEAWKARGDALIAAAKK